MPINLSEAIVSSVAVVTFLERLVYVYFTSLREEPELITRSVRTYLSVRGVMTRRGVLPRYSYEYWNCASQILA